MNDFGGRGEDKHVGNFTLFQANIRVYMGGKRSHHKHKRQINY